MLGGTDLVLNRVERVTTDLVEVFVNVLVRKIAADEDAVNQAISTSKLGECTGGLSLSKVVQQAYDYQLV